MFFIASGQQISQIKGSISIFCLRTDMRIKACGETGSEAIVFYSKVNPSIAQDIATVS